MANSDPPRDPTTSFWLPQLGSHMQQLDTLRAIAVGLVIVHHYEVADAFGGDTGRIGVQIFFVLSGFLITSILLRCRETIERGEQGPLITLRQFYVRRTLRIFPLYYLLLLIAVLANIPPVREAFGWYATYTSNIRTALTGEWGIRMGHVWSLAVEEQYYLIWPFVVLMAPRWALGPAMLAGIVAGPVFRVAVAAMGARPEAHLATMPGNLDALMFGALLAYLLIHLRKPAIVKLFIVVACPVVVAGSIIGMMLDSRFALVGKVTTMGAIGAVVIFFLARGLSGPWGRALELKPFLYIGKISYGVYIYHNLLRPSDWLLIPGVQAAINALGLPAAVNNAVLSALTGAVVVGMAAVSWHFFEAPINNLKDRFPYRVPRTATPPNRAA